MPLWSNSAARKTASDELASGFLRMNLPQTSAAVTSLGGAIATASSVRQLEVPLNAVFSQCEREYASDQHKQDVRDCLHDLLLHYLRGRPGPTHQSTIGAVVPNLEAKQKAEVGLHKLVNLLQNNIDPESLYLQTCVVYLVAVEAVFDQTLRTLFFLAKLAEGSQVSYANAHSLKVTTLRNEFNGLRMISNPAPLFEGHSNHLRNSIAHLNLQFEPATQSMIFEDRNPDTGTISWGPVKMTYPSFKDDYYGKIEDVSVYLSCIFGMIRARDLALARGVP